MVAFPSGSGFARFPCLYLQFFVLAFCQFRQILFCGIRQHSFPDRSIDLAFFELVRRIVGNDPVDEFTSLLLTDSFRNFFKSPLLMQFFECRALPFVQRMQTPFLRQTKLFRRGRNDLWLQFQAFFIFRVFLFRWSISVIGKSSSPCV